jgi:hypothetical protein
MKMNQMKLRCDLCGAEERRTGIHTLPDGWDQMDSGDCLCGYCVYKIEQKLQAYKNKG